MNRIHGFFAVLAKIAWVLAAIGMVALVFLVVAVVADVFMRYVFNSPIQGVRDLLSLFIVATMSAMMPVLMMVEGNISVNFVDYLKNKQFVLVVRVFANVVTTVVMALLSWQVWKYAAYLAKNEEITIILNAPVAPWWQFAAVMLAYSTLMSVYAIYRVLCPAANPEMGGAS